MQVLESMKALDFNTRTMITKYLAVLSDLQLYYELIWLQFKI